MKYQLFLLLLIMSFPKIHSQKVNSGKTYLHKSYSFQKQSKYDSALFYGRKALSFFKNFPNDSLKIKSMLQVISTTDNLDENDKLSKKIRLIVKNNNDTDLLEKLYYAKANNYFNSKNFDLAVKYFLKIDSLSKEINKIDEIIVKSIYKRAQISKLTFTYDGVELAHQLSLEALKKAKEIKNKDLENRIKLLISEILFLKEQPDKALKLLKEIEPLLIKNDQYNLLSRVFLLKTLYFKNDLKDYKKTDSIFTRSIHFFKKINYNKELADLYIFYGDFLKDIKKNHKKALRQYNLSDSIYYKNNPTLNLHYIYLLEGLSHAYEKLGNYKKGLYFNKLAYKNRKKLYKKQNRELSRKLEAKYQNQKKQFQIDLLNKQKKNQRNLFTSGLIIISLTSLYLFFAYRIRHKAYTKLKEIDALKSNLFTNISHELRTPLTLISAPLEKKLNSKKLSENDHVDFEMMYKNSQQLLNLVNQLLELSKLESGNAKLKVTQGDLNSLLKYLTASFDFFAKQKKINYSVKIKGLTNVWFDKNILEKITINLLSNAFKYTEDKNDITFRTIEKNGSLIMNVENSGVTLSKEKIETIFNRFYQADENVEGIGIGLSIVKELVTLSHGTISVKNSNNNSVCFKVTLPIEKKAFKEEELATKPEIDPVSLECEQPLNVLIKEQPIMLIVEDNDDVRTFIKKTFSDSYQIIEAKNGKIGIEKAISFIPDIIISDVMMPETDGIELCNRLKNDERTSHIPIILLTAKAAEDDEYKGLMTQADDYITKPFKIKLLKARIDNLITSRKLLRKRYNQEIILKPKDIAINDIDEQFLERLQNVIDKNITEPSFTVDKFSEIIGMSRMQLHRKLKALTNLSTSQFIRSQRLKLATTLLAKSDLNISEIGYMVGFNNHAYFSKCFKKAYGISPAQYSSKNKK